MTYNLKLIETDGNLLDGSFIVVLTSRHVALCVTAVGSLLSRNINIQKNTHAARNNSEPLLDMYPLSCLIDTLFITYTCIEQKCRDQRQRQHR